MPVGCVYLATNTVNQSCYIGKSISGMAARRKTHEAGARNREYPGFHAAIRKHGPEAFEWRVLFVSDDNDELLAAEVRLIAEFKANGVRLYNRTIGGEGAAGREITEEYLAKIRRPRSPEARAKMSASWTPERRAAQAEKMRNRVIDPNSVEKQANTIRGRKRDPEIVAKIARAKSGSKLPAWTEERRAKVRATRMANIASGKTAVSEETKAKMRASRAAHFERDPAAHEKARAAGMKGAAAHWSKP